MLGLPGMTAVLFQQRLSFHELGIMNLKKTLVYELKMTSFNQFPDNCDEKEKVPSHECYKLCSLVLYPLATCDFLNIN